MTNDPADIIISYFDSHGINDARAGAFNILDRLKQAGFIVRLAAQADAPDGWKLVPIHGAEEKVARIKAIGDEIDAALSDTRPDRKCK
jgi:hypothetical protein